MITYKCSGCRVVLDTDDSLAGQTEPCPECGHTNAVPVPRSQLKEQRRLQKHAQKLREVEEAQKRRRDAEVRAAAEQAATAERRRLDAERLLEERLHYEKALQAAKSNPQMAKNWHCLLDGKEWGPMPESRLQSWISEGRVKADSLIRPESTDVWIKAIDLPEIFVVPASSTQNLSDRDSPKCPKCGNRHISANKEGMKKDDACCGAILLGPLGLLCGVSHDVVITCLKCGHQWKPGR